MDDKLLYAHILNLHGSISERLESEQRVLPDIRRCWVMKELSQELRNQQYDEHNRRRLWLEWMNMAKDVGVPLLTVLSERYVKGFVGY